jgi:hypothetical protein
LSLAIATAVIGFSPCLLSAETKSGVEFIWAANKASSANAAIMAYLGDPVPPPEKLDAKYTPEGLIAAFNALCKQLGFPVQKLAVDDTEFPFLVYGVIGGRADYREIQTALRSTPGYTYGGSSTGSNNNDGTTYFSLNMTPSESYPRAQREAIRRRTMIRLQMLAAIWSDPIR